MLVGCRHIVVYMYLDHLECSGSGEYQDFNSRCSSYSSRLQFIRRRFIAFACVCITKLSRLIGGFANSVIEKIRKIIIRCLVFDHFFRNLKLVEVLRIFLRVCHHFSFRHLNPQFFFWCLESRGQTDRLATNICCARRTISKHLKQNAF